MTTIAYRGGVLAADTGMTIGETRLGRIVKISRRDDGVMAGAAGDSGYAAAFKKWVMEGCQGDPPTARESHQHLDRGVIFYPCGKIEVFEPGGRFVVEDVPYYALGSGRPEALGAMFAGADAPTAVAAAIEHDAGTFGDITVLHHEPVSKLQAAE